jgi:hypothetical protein
MAAPNRAFVLSFSIDCSDGYAAGAVTAPVGGQYIIFEGATGKAVNAAGCSSPIGNYGSSYVTGPGAASVNFATVEIDELIVDCIRAIENDPTLQVIRAF